MAKPDEQFENSFPNPERLTTRSDAELVEYWKQGVESAASILTERYRIRLVALVASRIAQKYQGRIEPEDIVQSAMGSLFVRNT